MHIRTEPEGAIVYVDGRRIEKSAREIPFLWYGTRHVLLVAEGHEPVMVPVRLRPPIYEIPPFDFVSEVLVPWTITDVHEVSVDLVPLEEEDVSGLLERAEDYRRLE